MTTSDRPSGAILKEAFEDLEEPIVFRGMLKGSDGLFMWKLLEWNLSDLSEKFGDEQLPFRVGYNGRSTVPQWESQCSTKYMTLKEFLEISEAPENNHLWYYFDYKYMHQWLADNPDVLSSLNWQIFGFDKTGSDSTLWIGNEGAHTICHRDTYGCNLVAQIHGRKQWLLFPPTCGNQLQPTRIPYEESTVYSKFNFFSPSEEDDNIIMNVCRMPKLVELEPGDVLFVPKGWWHYVESLTISVSVNVWLPVDSDSQSRLTEALVMLINERISQNPSADSLSCCLKLIELCLKELENKTCISKDTKVDKNQAWTAAELFNQFPRYIKVLNDLDKSQLKEFLRDKRERFPLTVTQLGGSEQSPINNLDLANHQQNLLESIVNAFSHPDIIIQVAKQFLTTQTNINLKELYENKIT